MRIDDYFNDYNTHYDIPDEKLYPEKDEDVVNPNPKSLEEIRSDIEYAIDSSETSMIDKILLMRVLKAFND